MIDVIHEYEKTEPKQHPVGLTDASTGNPSLPFDGNAVLYISVSE